MKKLIYLIGIMALISTTSSFLGFSFSPNLAFADNSGPCTAPNTPVGCCPPTTPPTPTTSDCFKNPIGATSILDLIANLASKLYLFAIPISSIFILWGAFQIMTSGGAEEKISAGKKTIFYAIGGLILMLFASGIGYIIQDVLGS